MFRGLMLVGFGQARQKVRQNKNLSRFRTWYGSNPIVYSTLWQRLNQTTIPEAWITWHKGLTFGRKTRYFFMSIHFLACYPKEEEAEGIWGRSDRTWHKWVWHIIGCISYLKPEIIVWPTHWGNPNSGTNDETIFIITVNGTHCPINEPTHPEFSDNTKFYSHKFKSAGLNYEVALSIYNNKCVWINGPFPAGDNDILVFRSKLKAKMLEARANSPTQTMYIGIGDKGYRGEKSLITIPNSHVALFSENSDLSIKFALQV